ncbi:uncharacterized protein METZ01_LOCUS400801 [marine metagenome]|uniref:Uncharacterized protein n=1 Tax=marine metagenome TaxID=408172 RepID=A0A382VN25_9ZZZZ
MRKLSGIFWKELHKSMQYYPTREQYKNKPHERIHKPL